MSQDFKFKYDRMRENDPTGADAPSGVDAADANYSTIGNARNICFVWLSGRKLFLNYSYLVSCDYDRKSITMSFTSHTVVLKGVQLGTLFDGLMNHLPRVITCMDERYSLLVEKDGFAVTGIEATPVS